MQNIGLGWKGWVGLLYDTFCYYVAGASATGIQWEHELIPRHLLLKMLIEIHTTPNPLCAPPTCFSSKL